MKLGLLSESGQNVARIREQPTYVSFGHKLLQEWAGAYYIARCLERTTVIKVKYLSIYLLFLYKSSKNIISCQYLSLTYFIRQVKKSNRPSPEMIFHKIYKLRYNSTVEEIKTKRYYVPEPIIHTSVPFVLFLTHI